MNADEPLTSTEQAVLYALAYQPVNPNKITTDDIRLAWMDGMIAGFVEAKQILAKSSQVSS